MLAAVVTQCSCMFLLSGNDNIDLDNLAALGWAYTPCLVNLSNIVCVGGTDPLDQLVGVLGGERHLEARRITLLEFVVTGPCGSVVTGSCEPL